MYILLLMALASMLLVAEWLVLELADSHLVVDTHG
jgi:hypothetical protein